MGRLIQKSRHRLLCGDATNADDWAKLGELAEAVCFTSPPYVLQRTYRDSVDLSPTHLAEFVKNAQAAGVDLLAVNLGIARSDGVIVRYWDEYIGAANSCGLGLVSWNVWYRQGGFSVGQITATFPIQHEWIFVFSSGKVKLIPTVENVHGGTVVQSTNRDAAGQIGEMKKQKTRRFRELGSVFESAPVSANSDHPAKFPVSFPVAYLKAFGREKVVDPFLGSGSTLIAAEQLGRRCFGMEISPAYCDVVVKRWENLTGETARRE